MFQIKTLHLIRAALRANKNAGFRGTKYAPMDKLI
jgi:hypothetical protein